mmetsp:Transcript_92251/g.180731  ORF Transcript_92251/g.180731 Transcript_92251/m.180731 type:complete len:343 (+) Transcript_92251:128-1156(+)
MSSFDLLDVEIFENLDFGLLDDNGNFEEFCSSMDFDPLKSCNRNDDVKSISPTNSDVGTKKRKLGALKLAAAAATDTSPIAVSAESSSSDQPSEKNIKGIPFKMARDVGKRSVQLDASDVRTKYIEIFADMLNNFEKSTFPTLAGKYCTNDLIVIWEVVGENPYGHPSYMEVRGVETFSKFWENVTHMVPDALFRIHSTKYKVLPNNYISIVSGYTFAGTKMYGMRGIEMHDEKVVISMGKPDVINDGTSSKFHFNSGNSNGDSLVASRPEEDDDDIKSTSSVPNSKHACDVEYSNLIGLSMSIIGTLTLYVNPENKVHRISFVYSMRKAISGAGTSAKKKD